MTPITDNAWDICIEHLDGGYGERLVLSDLSACLPGGAITAILGESGCGKTTLLRIILGLTPPRSGRILLGGRDIFSLSARQFHKVRRRFGVLFQDGALLGALTLAENVALPLREHTTLPHKILREAALRTLQLVGLENFADFYLANFPAACASAPVWRGPSSPNLLYCSAMNPRRDSIPLPPLRWINCCWT